MPEMNYQVSIKTSGAYSNEKLLEKFYKYYLEEKLVDVTFICSQHQFIKAHRLVLSTVSSFFNDLFKMNCDGQLYIVLLDVTYELLRDFLDFLYKGSLTIKEDILPDFIKLIKYFHIEGVDERELSDNRNISTNAEVNTDLNEVCNNSNPTTVEECLTQEPKQLDSTSSINRTKLDNFKQIKIPLVNYNFTDIQKSKVPDADETICQLPELLKENKESNDTDVEENVQSTPAEQDKNNSKEINCSSNKLDSNKDCGSMILQTTESLQIIESDIPLVVLQDSEVFTSSQNKPTRTKKKQTDTEDSLPSKVTKYGGHFPKSSNSDSCSSDEINCCAPKTTLQINDTMDTDELLFKSLQLMSKR